MQRGTGYSKSVAGWFKTGEVYIRTVRVRSRRSSVKPEQGRVGPG